MKAEELYAAADRAPCGSAERQALFRDAAQAQQAEEVARELALQAARKRDADRAAKDAERRTRRKKEKAGRG